MEGRGCLGGGMGSAGVVDDEQSTESCDMGVIHVHMRERKGGVGREGELAHVRERARLCVRKSLLASEQAGEIDKQRKEQPGSHTPSLESLNKSLIQDRERSTQQRKEQPGRGRKPRRGGAGFIAAVTDADTPASGDTPPWKGYTTPTTTTTSDAGGSDDADVPGCGTYDAGGCPRLRHAACTASGRRRGDFGALRRVDHVSDVIACRT